MEVNYTNQQIEEILNWTLSGLTMYYRDSDLPESVIAKYEPGKIFRSPTFVDVSATAGQLTTNCRFIFASSKAAPLYQINPVTAKWQLHSLNANSYFKVLDVYKKGEKTQVFLLHIPAQRIDFFRNTVLRLGADNLEEQIIGKSRASLDQKMQLPPIPALEEKEWIARTNFPIGLDNHNEFFSLHPSTEMPPQAMPLFTAIVKLTHDSALNWAPPVMKKDVSSDKVGFWKRLFG